MNQLINKEIIVKNLGLLNYQQAWDFQTSLFEEIAAIKTNNRHLVLEQQQITPNYLLFVEHPPVYTLGKSGKEENLLLNAEQLESKGIEYYKINRGGDITFHGPGQLVAYPIFDLENFFTDIHLYLRTLEEAVINTCAHFGIQAGRITGLTGVWVEERKICAMGVRTSRWIAMHGLALNVNTDLRYFSNIIPCGIDDKAVTSMQAEIGQALDMAEVTSVLEREIRNLFVDR